MYSDNPIFTETVARWAEDATPWDLLNLVNLPVSGWEHIETWTKWHFSDDISNAFLMKIFGFLFKFH